MSFECIQTIDLVIYAMVTNIYENSAWGKTSGNFGGFLIGNNILSDLGISIGNPQDAS
jgi:hypothetical protein